MCAATSSYNNLKNTKFDSIPRLGSRHISQTRLLTSLGQTLRVSCAGSILLDGQDVSQLDAEWLRSQVAVVSQEPALLAGTVADAIRYGRTDAPMEQVVAASRAANAHDFIEALPHVSDVPVLAASQSVEDECAAPPM